MEPAGARAHEHRQRANAALRTAQPGSGVQPREIYQSEITDALLNVVLDYPGALGIGPGEWLTVAARETVVDRRFVNGGVIEAPMTVILRMKGSDLQALREHKLSRDEVRTKVDVQALLESGLGIRDWD